MNAQQQREARLESAIAALAIQGLFSLNGTVKLVNGVWVSESVSTQSTKNEPNDEGEK